MYNDLHQLRENNMKECHDCGSTIVGHHTPWCEFADENDIRDLPQQGGTQWWTGEVPAHLQRNIIKDGKFVRADTK